MAASPSKEQIARKLRSLRKKQPDEQFVVLRASNGEVAIVTQNYLNSCRPRKEATAR